MYILRELILEPLQKALFDIGIDGNSWEKMLGPSREKSQGDLSLPCFAFAKQLGKSPNEIAEILSSSISGEFGVSSNGGYLNFAADPFWLANKVLFGDVERSNKSVLIEHTLSLIHI